MSRTVRSGSRPPIHVARPTSIIVRTLLVLSATVAGACASAPARSAEAAESQGGLAQVRPDTLASPVSRAAQPERMAQRLGAETIDTAAIRRIRDEGMQRSQVMQIAGWLTDVYGPRLTNSPTHRAAAEWSMKTMTGWGLSNARLEMFPFGRGWSNERVSVHVTAPQAYPVIAYAAAWTPGTNGRVSGPAVHLVPATICTRADLEKHRGKLRHAFVMVSNVNPAQTRVPFTPPAQRRTEEQLRELENWQPQAQQAGQRGGGPGGPGGGGGCRPVQGQQQMSVAQIRQALRTPAPADTMPLSNQNRTALFNEFLAMEGIGALVSTNQARGSYGVFTVGSGQAGSRVAGDAVMLPQVMIAPEQYGRILRTMEKGMPVSMEVEVRNTFHEATESFNVLAEIPGTDKRDEIVMLGAHFDSWHAGTGATDNASGSAVMMEAMRILKATGVPLRRTVRIGLWGGEEQGLIGSRAHVTQHYAERGQGGQPGARKPGYDRFSVYFNMDNGTGAFRGVYAQGNTAAVPVFREWIAPLRDLGISMVTLQNTGSTDHASFDAVGLPGFQFVQDPVEYSSRTHHSNQDTFERLIEDDLKKNATIVAAFAFLAATRDELFPRKPAAVPATGAAR